MDFIKSNQGRVCHIGTMKKSDGYRYDYNLLCGQTFDRWSGVRTIKPSSNDYPMGLGDVCSRCQEKEEAAGFLDGVSWKEPPKMVETKVVVDLNIPKLMSIREAELFTAHMDDVIEKHREIADTIEFNVKFG